MWLMERDHTGKKPEVDEPTSGQAAEATDELLLVAAEADEAFVVRAQAVPENAQTGGKALLEFWTGSRERRVAWSSTRVVPTVDVTNEGEITQAVFLRHRAGRPRTRVLEPALWTHVNPRQARSETRDSPAAQRLHILVEDVFDGMCWQQKVCVEHPEQLASSARAPRVASVIPMGHRALRTRRKNQAPRSVPCNFFQRRFEGTARISTVGGDHDLERLRIGALFTERQERPT